VSVSRTVQERETILCVCDTLQGVCYTTPFLVLRSQPWASAAAQHRCFAVSASVARPEVSVASLGLLAALLLPSPGVASCSTVSLLCQPAIKPLFPVQGGGSLDAPLSQ
jgi:hypothetical protein